MLSIIICHRNPQQLETITASIAATVGVPYEVIVLDNTQNAYSIFSAYNEGVRRSHYPVCCFTHEDITYHTPGWGRAVLAHFEEEAVGMIGVTGGMIATAAPGAWWYNYARGYCATSIIESRDRPEPDYNYLNPFGETPRTPVATADGLWFCIRRSLFEHIRFDDQTFSGFHLYDADISLQVQQYAQVYVVYDVLLRHYSSGPTSKEYYHGLITLARKWHARLPVHAPRIPAGTAHAAGWYHLRRFLLDAAAAGFSKDELEAARKEFIPLLRHSRAPLWHRAYFALAATGGQRLANAIFERLERLRPLSRQSRVHRRPAEELVAPPTNLTQ